ncbi:uncharacterized protein TNCV_4351311 [Trichonephila clavipes]|nr:uncharacterized protein TNCV_4351311 [Trichonephila clavipes]
MVRSSGQYDVETPVFSSQADLVLIDRPTEGMKSSDSQTFKGCGNPVVKVSDHGRHIMSSSPVPLKTCRVGKRYTLNLSRAETSTRWCGVVVRRGGAGSGVVH